MTMGRRLKGYASALALLFVCSAPTLLAGSASAAAAPPIVIGSCATSVQGAPGTPVSLNTDAVLGLVYDTVRGVLLAGPLLAETVRSTLAGLPPIPIGVIPSGTSHISGAVIATKVVERLPVLGTLAAPAVRSALTAACGVAMTGVNAVAAPVQEGAKAVADASQQVTESLVPGVTPGPGRGLPGAPGAPGGGGSGPGGAPAQTPPPALNQPVVGGSPNFDLGWFLWGRSPMLDYGSIPYARPGLWAPSPGVRYGGSVGGYTPQFGILGTDDADGVQAAGRAEALRPTGGTKIALPVLLAVLALSGVTAGLVRTWVLRRAPLPVS
jgi:hypothetical protein